MCWVQIIVLLNWNSEEYIYLIKLQVDPHILFWQRGLTPSRPGGTIYLALKRLSYLLYHRVHALGGAGSPLAYCYNIFGPVFIYFFYF